MRQFLGSSSAPIAAHRQKRPCHVGLGIASDTFGEFLQGALPGKDNHFLVTLPIAAYSKAVFIPNVTGKDLTVSSQHKIKSLRLTRFILKEFDLQTGGHLILESSLLEGKGFASSSADLVATARFVVHAINEELGLDSILPYLREIEPTDGVMYPDFVTFYHRRVRLRQVLGLLPALRILVVDEGGAIDTVRSDQCGTFFTDHEKSLYAQLLDELNVAFENKDLAVLGQITTESALLNQRHNPKKYLEQVIDIAEKQRCLGVAVTHSGPWLGILLAQADPERQVKEAAVCKALCQLIPTVGQFRSLDFQRYSNLVHAMRYQGKSSEYFAEDQTR